MSEFENHLDEPPHRPEEPVREGENSPGEPHQTSRSPDELHQAANSPDEPRDALGGAGDALAEPAHDVLAAEEFAMPAPDPRLHHGPVALPGDPTGIAVAHDVLAAEEFAMPAPEPRVVPGASTAGSGSRWRIGISATATALLVVLARRRLRRR